MKIVRLVVLGLLLVWTTGCRKLKDTMFPGNPKTNQADPASICRANPIYMDRVVNSDNIDFATGEIQGEDGVFITVYACPNDNKLPDFTGCSAFTETGFDANGVGAVFQGSHVFIQLAQSKGYKKAMAKIEYSCHGG